MPVIRVTITDFARDPARACSRTAVAALGGNTGARVGWPTPKGLNEWERKALKLSEERSNSGAFR